MKVINNVKITRIATVLQTLSGNNVVGGEPGIALVRAEQMHNFGKELMEIIEDEMGSAADSKAEICPGCKRPVETCTGQFGACVNRGKK